MNTTNNKKWDIYPTNELGRDKVTNRYYVSLYLDNKDKKADSYLVYVSCDEYDDCEPTNLTIQFLNAYDANPIDMPYDSDLFMDIEMDACIVFQDMKDELEKVTG